MNWGTHIIGGLTLGAVAISQCITVPLVCLNLWLRRREQKRTRDWALAAIADNERRLAESEAKRAARRAVRRGER